jgi:hypothetical protein
MASLEIENGMFVKAWGDGVFTISREKITDAKFIFDKKEFYLKEEILERLSRVYPESVLSSVLEEIFCGGIKPICSPFDLEIALNSLVAENKINFGFNARFGEFKGFKCYSLKK